MEKKNINTVADSKKESATLSAEANPISVIIASLPGLEKETWAALKSFVTFLQGYFNFFLVGAELPGILVRDAGLSPTQIPFSFTDNRHDDYSEIMRILLADGGISENFVFVPPRCWLVDRIGLHHIMIDKHVGPLLAPGATYADDDPLVKTNTAFLAQNYPYPLLNFNTGYPVYLQKAYVADSLSFIDESGEVLDFFNVYGNQLRGMSHPIQCRVDDEWGLNIKSANVSEAVFAEHITHKCFLRTELDHMPPIIEEYVSGLLDD